MPNLFEFAAYITNVDSKWLSILKSTFRTMKAHSNELCTFMTQIVDSRFTRHIMCKFAHCHTERIAVCLADQ
jgi:hypothetical protein